MPTHIHPFPELRALAESEARDAYSSMREVGIMYPYDDHGRRREDVYPWDQIPSGTRDWWVAARIMLLCDLTRPASRDAVCRLVVEHLGCSLCGLHAILAGEVEAFGVFGDELAAVISGMPPAAALTAIVAHLWPSE